MKVGETVQLVGVLTTGIGIGMELLTTSAAGT